MASKTLIVGVCLLALTGCVGEEDRVAAEHNGSAADPPETVETKPDDNARMALMRGLFTYMADAAVFEDCDGGARYPVAMESDYISAERAYLDARTKPGAPLLVTFEGRVAQRPPMEGDGTVGTVVIGRFVSTYPGEDCETVELLELGL